MLKIGDTAPSFTLFSSEKNEVSLFRLPGPIGSHFVLPLAFTGVCTTELCNTRDDIQSYKNLNAQVIAISVDSLFTLEKFKAEQNLNFPLLADFNRTVSADYGCLYEDFVLGMKKVAKGLHLLSIKMELSNMQRYWKVLEIYRTLSPLKIPCKICNYIAI